MGRFWMFSVILNVIKEMVRGKRDGLREIPIGNDPIVREGQGDDHLTMLRLALCPSYRNVFELMGSESGWVRVLDVRYHGYKPRTFL